MYKKFYIANYGCQMNVYDSQKISDLMKYAGFKETPNASDAEILIFYTCNIRENAARKTFSNIGLLKSEKTQVIAVGGCVAQALGAAAFEKSKFINIVFGPQTYHRLPGYVKSILDNKTQNIIDTDLCELEKFKCLPKRKQVSFSEFVTIQEGCNNFCTYCAVPYTRGRERSRPAVDIITEVKELIANGAKEITLLGQNVNSYHGDAPYITIGQKRQRWRLERLLQEIGELNGIKRLRYTTSHPKDLTTELMNVHATIPNLVPFIHLPAQSGNDRILQIMNRNHTVQDYVQNVDKFRDICPSIQFSSDFIVGFPTETEDEFEDTIHLVEKVKYTISFSFKYSKRPNTPAASMKNQIPDKDKEQRLDRLQEALAKDQKGYNEALIGQTQEVLFERPGKKENQYIGKNVYMQSIVVESAKNIIGTFANVLIKSASKNCVFGKVVC